MKKMITLLLATMLAVSLSACATTKGGTTTKVKCPACGYEFEAALGG
ncbi:hypothetical protein [Trichloromonas sp.]|nr:hypothetical protein [Trichloromonas sp.]